MADRPILFSGTMVRALLAGRKTQTRRVLKNLQPPADADKVFAWFPPIGATGNWAEGGLWADQHLLGELGYEGGFKRFVGSLPYEPGDRLWVREAHYLTDDGDFERAVCAIDKDAVAAHLAHIDSLEHSHSAVDWKRHKRFRPPMFMPRWASRMTLLVTDVRVQRVQEISTNDVLDEGVEPDSRLLSDAMDATRSELLQRIAYHDAHVLAFRQLWDGLNEKRGFGWSGNPWVVALTFAVVRENIDRAGVLYE